MLGGSAWNAREVFLWAEWLWERLCLFVCFLFCFFNSPSWKLLHLLIIRSKWPYKTLGVGLSHSRCCLWQGLALKDLTLSLLPVWFQGWGESGCVGVGYAFSQRHQHCEPSSRNPFSWRLPWWCRGYDFALPMQEVGFHLWSGNEIRLPQLKILPAAMRTEDPTWHN